MDYDLANVGSTVNETDLLFGSMQRRRLVQWLIDAAAANVWERTSSRRRSYVLVIKYTVT